MNTVAETIFTSLQASKFILGRRSFGRTQGVSEAMRIMVACADRIIALRTAQLVEQSACQPAQVSL